MAARKATPRKVVIDVLSEAGYRCAVPTCRTILAIDLHHIVEVAEGGPNDVGNFLALCPTCHALYHRGVIDRDSIYIWKRLLVSLNQAFDIASVDNLVFLNKSEAANLRVSGDGVLQFSRLIAANLATFELMMQNGPLFLYRVTLTNRGKLLVDAWSRGDRQAVASAITGEGGNALPCP